MVALSVNAETFPSMAPETDFTTDGHRARPSDSVSIFNQAGETGHFLDFHKLGKSVLQP